MTITDASLVTMMAYLKYPMNESQLYRTAFQDQPDIRILVQVSN